MPTTTEEKLIDIKFKLDMYYSLADSPESTLEKIEDVIKPKANLNENQQIVLEWLKEQVSIGNDLQYVLWEFTDNVYEEPAEYSVSEQTKAWLELTEQEQFQVLAAFAQWGLEQEED